MGEEVRTDIDEESCIIGLNETKDGDEVVVMADIGTEGGVLKSPKVAEIILLPHLRKFRTIIPVCIHSQILKWCSTGRESEGIRYVNPRIRNCLIWENIW